MNYLIFNNFFEAYLIALRFYLKASKTISLSNYNSFDAYSNEKPFYFTASNMNYLSFNNSFDAYLIALSFYLIASKTISLSDYNSFDACSIA